MQIHEPWNIFKKGNADELLIRTGHLLQDSKTGRGGPEVGTGHVRYEGSKLFFRGFRKHTGLGMFLIKEILSITGITVRETGVYQKGARFDLLVPREYTAIPNNLWVNGATSFCPLRTLHELAGTLVFKKGIGILTGGAAG